MTNRNLEVESCNRQITVPEILSKSLNLSQVIDQELNISDLSRARQLFESCLKSDNPRSALQDLLARRGELSQAFIPLLIRLQQKLQNSGDQDSEMGIVLQENLDEELGLVNTSFGQFGHNLSRQNYLQAVSADQPELLDRPKHLASVVFIETHNKIIDSELVSTKLAYALMAYWEWRVSRPNSDYSLILKSVEQVMPELKKEVYVPGDPLYHVYSHAELDQDHAEEFINVLKASVKTNQDLNDIVLGVRLGRKLWDYYWESIMFNL